MDSSVCTSVVEELEASRCWFTFSCRLLVCCQGCHLPLCTCSGQYKCHIYRCGLRCVSTGNADKRTAMAKHCLRCTQLQRAKWNSSVQGWLQPEARRPQNTTLGSKTAHTAYQSHTRGTTLVPLLVHSISTGIIDSSICNWIRLTPSRTAGNCSNTVKALTSRKRYSRNETDAVV